MIALKENESFAISDAVYILYLDIDTLQELLLDKDEFTPELQKYIYSLYASLNVIRKNTQHLF